MEEPSAFGKENKGKVKLTFRENSYLYAE